MIVMTLVDMGVAWGVFYPYALAQVARLEAPAEAPETPELSEDTELPAIAFDPEPKPNEALGLVGAAGPLAPVRASAAWFCRTVLLQPVVVADLCGLAVACGGDGHGKKN